MIVIDTERNCRLMHTALVKTFRTCIAKIFIASNRRTRRKFSVYVQYIFRLRCCRKCMDAIERLVFTAAAAVIVDVAIASNFA